MEELKKYIKKNGITQAFVAKVCAMSETQLSLTLEGKRTLRFREACRLEKLTGISQRDLQDENWKAVNSQKQ